MKKLKNTIYYVLWLTIGLSTLTGCIDEYEADIAAEDANLLVVEGTICANSENKFTLSWTDPLTGEYTPQWAMSAKISVRGTDGTEYPTEGGYGYYTCQLGNLNPDVEYYLHIEVGDDIYESIPQKPLPTEKIADVRGTQETEESNIEVLVTPAEPTDNSKVNYYSWTYKETWEVHPDYTTVYYYDRDAKTAKMNGKQFPERGWKDETSSTVMIGSSTSYQNQHIERLKLYEIERTSQRMFYRYSGLIRQRAISKGEYEYEMARLQASEDMGGLFTPLPSALPTNIRCLTGKKHVIGYIGCSLNTSEYRFFMNRKDYSIYRKAYGDLRLWVENPTHEDCVRLLDRGMFLCEWQDERQMEGTLKTAWAFQYQLDVRLNGCYIEKPDYWDSEENISY